MSLFRTTPLLRIAALAVLAAAAAPRLAHATWPHDPYAGNVALCTQAGTQQNEVAASDGAGGAIIAWQDSRNATGPDIYVQRISAAGVPLWTADGVLLCNATNDQSMPSIAADGAGGVIVTWQDLRTGSNYDIFAQRVNANGTVLWAANGVPVCQAANGQLSPRVVSDGASGAIITWQDSRVPAGDIYAQRLNGSGVAQWAVNGLPICAATNTQTSPDLVADGAGGAMIVWEDYRASFADVYAQHVNGAGVMQFTTDGVAVCNATGDQQFPDALSDGQGGMLVAWQDSRAGSTNFDIYAQRVTGTGSMLWNTNGIGVCTSTGHQTVPSLATDGSSGAIVTWTDQRSGNYDIYASRLTAGGALPWSLNGVSIATGTGDQSSPVIASDGLGGAILAWEDTRNNAVADVYAQRISDTGTTQWGTNGVVVCGAAQSQVGLTIAADNANGAIVSWRDFRNGSGLPDVYAQRVDLYGELGNAEPRITSVRDVPNDQGGFVKLSWSSTYLDRPGMYRFPSYIVMRSVPPQLLAQGALARRGLTTDLHEAATTGKLFVETNATTDIAWEAVQWLNGYGFTAYSYVTPTVSDSTAAGAPRTLFRVGVEYYNQGPGNYEYWFSAPDSAYSVDNIAPVAPSPFTGAYAAGTTHLAWNPNHEADLAGYRLYRGVSTSFVPSPANLVSAQPDTGYADAAGAAYVYKLTAVDVHGNESAVATVVPSGTVDAPGLAAGELALAAPTPNPARGAATLHWTLPRTGAVKLEVYDTAGRRVRTLVEGDTEAGEHATRFAFEDANGRALPNGLYLVRLQAAGRVLTQRVMAIR